MIIRIVKMEFQPEKVVDFLAVFNQNNQKIRHFDGCQHLELWRATNADDSNIFFTYSHWQSEEHLNRYRQSKLFRNAWTTVKQLFIEKPQAWSVEQIVKAN